jgi:hypothetical protein
LSHEENAQPPTELPKVVLPDMEKRQRGADLFPQMHPEDVQNFMTRPGPFGAGPETGAPQGSVAPQSAPAESSD